MAEEVTEIDQMPDFVIVTGMSGAGRTEAMHVFEDLGYFCVDNLPSSLLGELVRVNDETDAAGGRRRLAVVCDSRNGDFFGDLDAELSAMAARGISYKTLFLDAADDKLIARYKSSRRRHPLCTDGTTIWQGIQRERHLLMGLRDKADFVIDTTDMLPQKLRSTIRLPLDCEQEEAVNTALADEKVRNAVAGKQVFKTIVVKNKIVNLVVK